MFSRGLLGQVTEGARLQVNNGTDFIHPASFASFSFGCRAGGPRAVLRPVTDGDVPVVRQAKHRSREYGNVYRNVLSLFKSPCHSTA